MFYFNERFEFCAFLNEIKKIHDADLFSQPPLLIFTKGANFSEQQYVCKYIYIYIYIYIY